MPLAQKEYIGINTIVKRGNDMKKIKSKLAIILMMMLIVTSFEFVGVFAEGEDGDAPAVAPAATEEMQDTDVKEEAPVVTEEAVEAEGEADEAVPEAEEVPTSTKQESSYSITYKATGEGSVTNPEDYCVASKIQGSTATPNDGYALKGWFFDGAEEAFSTEEALTAEAVLAKLAEEGKTSGEFEAKFEVNIQINDLHGLSSYKSVYLRWQNPAPAEDVTYTITCNGETVNADVTKRGDDEKYDPGYFECKITGLSSDINCNTGKYPSYSFTVTATSKSDPSITKTAKKSCSPVKTIAYKIKVKSSSTLTSHYGPDGKKNASKKFTVKKGQYIYAYGYGFGGKYVFRDPRGYVFFCNLTRTKRRSCVYTSGWNYTDEEATLFVNDRGVSSSRDSLVWVNTFTQHIYLFKRVDGKWVLNGVSAECSTGKASSPSPTVQNGMKSVEGYIRKRHGIPYWTKYSGINAIHAKKAKWKMGRPASNGCVRNYESNAKKIYDRTRKGTRVFLY